MSKSIPSRRRYVHPDLQAHGAKPLVSKKEQQQQHLVGISVAGWDIGTSQGPIGDSAWFDQALETLEPMSQYKASKSNDQQRQLVLPEMVFPFAHVILNFRHNRSAESETNDVLCLSWDAMECLKEWAAAHQEIPLPSNDDEVDIDTNNSKSTPPSIEFRGVSVLQSSDATLWKRKRQQQEGSSIGDATGSTNISTTTTFHYDWTYSSGYWGTSRIATTNETNMSIDWKPLTTSGMPMQLLTDQSVPILYFDQIVLLEDDLHDNGQVQLTVKIRVMPTCAYVLSQLFVRVDEVLVRVRETRLMVDFGSHKLYRDVTWRECHWENLTGHHLPNSVKAWTHNETQPHSTDPAAFAQLLQRVPLVPLPEDILPHVEFDYGTASY